MIFQHTWEKVLSGEKTQTRRIALPHADGTGTFDCEMIGYPMGIKSVQRLKVGADRWKTVYQVGKDYAVCPGRGQYAFTQRIRITDVRYEDVRCISAEDVKAEGFETASDFFITWCKMHDKGQMLPIIPDYFTGAIVWQGVRSELQQRPAERYQAWVLTFELVKQAAQ